MTIVLEFSTDADIIGTQLDPLWNPVTARFGWNAVSQANLNIAGGETLVVVAHGNGQVIGNADPGTGVDVDAATFLTLIVHNVAAPPNAVYVSTCAQEIAEFVAAVRLVQQQNHIASWNGLYGHCDPVVGPVPPPNDIRWIQIF